MQSYSEKIKPPNIFVPLYATFPNKVQLNTQTDTTELMLTCIYVWVWIPLPAIVNDRVMEGVFLN